MWFIINLIKKPTISDGYKSINKLGYNLVNDNLIKDFTNIINPTNWGSARPDVDSVFIPEMVDVTGDKIKITTKAQQTDGLDWNGKKVTRPSATGMILTDEICEMVGLYSVVILQDDAAIGSWDAWWFFENHPDMDPSYQEIDMIERFYGGPNNKRSLTTSVHHARLNESRSMYNSGVKIKNDVPYMLSIEFPKKSNKFKIYYNGLLIFVGLQWKPTRPTAMIIGSGLLGNSYKYAEKNLKEKDYFFEVSEIKYWNK